MEKKEIYMSKIKEASNSQTGNFLVTAEWVNDEHKTKISDMNCVGSVSLRTTKNKL